MHVRIYVQVANHPAARVSRLDCDTTSMKFFLLIDYIFCL